MLDAFRPHSVGDGVKSENVGNIGFHAFLDGHMLQGT